MAKFHIGICRLEKLGYGGAAKRTLAIAEHFAKRFDITVLTNDVLEWQQRQHFFGVDLSQVTIIKLRPLPQLFLPRLWRQTQWGRRLEQIVTLRYYIRQIQTLRLDLFISSSPNITIPPLAQRSIYMCTFPTSTPNSMKNVDQISMLRRLGATGKHWLKEALFDSTSKDVPAQFDVITANSRFTQDWIQKKWKLPSTIVYSACEMVGPVYPKAKIICHAARFTEGRSWKSPLKRQDILIEIFKALSDLHQKDWQLHLAGGFNATPENQAYLQQLMSAAQGYPIFFHVNASLSELHRLYQSASLYWHATGYGLDVQCYPAAHEHFGMTTVEAMSAGAVPVVINTGGQAEVVAHGVNGFVWDQLSELAAYTRRLANDPGLRATMSKQAVIDCQKYSKANFLARMDTIVDQLLADVRHHPSSRPQ